MRWKRPHHTRWFAACMAALLLATLAGGFSLRVATVFVMIFGVGAALLNLDDPDDEFDELGYSRLAFEPLDESPDESPDESVDEPLDQPVDEPLAEPLDEPAGEKDQASSIS